MLNARAHMRAEMRGNGGVITLPRIQPSGLRFGSEQGVKPRRIQSDPVSGSSLPVFEEMDSAPTRECEKRMVSRNGQ
jgi:hypothetical protein